MCARAWCRYALDQELGEQVNELTEGYFRQHPRTYEDAWPSDRYREDDLKLRALFEQLADNKVRPAESAGGRMAASSRPQLAPAAPSAASQSRNSCRRLRHDC